MEQLLESTSFRVFAAVSAVLVIKMVCQAYLVGAIRGKKKRYTNPEDAKLFKGERGDTDDETVARISRGHRNSLENEPLFILLGLLWVLQGADTQAIQIYSYTFLGFRVLHGLTYGLKLQPWRTLSYTVASLCLIGMSVQILMGAFSH